MDFSKHPIKKEDKCNVRNSSETLLVHPIGKEVAEANRLGQMLGSIQGHITSEV